MKNTVEIQIKDVYGRELIYPINTVAIKLAALIGKKTFNQVDILHIKELGFSVSYVPRSA